MYFWKIFYTLIPFISIVYSLLPIRLDFIDFQLTAKDWYETASFYQIYPRSFKDSNGDGIGDLNGITSELRYLKELGITATWLSPIFKSPMADFGYDISDFYDIQPEYGSLDDFDNLLKIANEIGIKIILDFVPNHSSDENEWFRKSVDRDERYKDFYVWHPGKMLDNGTRLPPSNWISVFRKSAWEWNEKRGEYYLHQFTVKQPDLNYRNWMVVEEMKFWLDRGVAGFRIDAVPFLFEVNKNADGNYPNEPLSGNTQDPDDYGYLNHIYTNDQNETLDMVYQWRELMNEYKIMHGGDTRVMLTESYSPIDVVMKYYGNGTNDGAHIPFNFLFITQLGNSSNAHDFKRTIDTWLNNMPKGRSANWVMGNHDQKRVATRFNPNRIDIMNMIILTLPGTSITYNGEEIGMTDVWISWKDTVDPAACNSNPNIYEQFTRDPERTPFQWDDSISAGFSTNNKTWLPISPDYKIVNLKNQNATAKSHLRVYKDLMLLRNLPVVKFGNVIVKDLSSNVLIVERSLGDDMIIIIVNIGSDRETINFKDFNVTTNKQFKFLIVSVSSEHRVGEIIDTTIELIVMPQESFVISNMNKGQRISFRQRVLNFNEYYGYELIQNV